MKKLFTIKKIGITILAVLIIIGVSKLYKEKSRSDLTRKIQSFNQLIKERQDNYLDISELIVPIANLQFKVNNKDYSEANKMTDEIIAKLENIGEEKSLKGILPHPKSNCVDSKFVNTKAFEAEPYITADGKTLYFQYHPYVDGKCAGVEREGFTCGDFEEKHLGPQTYKTKFKNGAWTMPKIQHIKDCNNLDNTCVIISASPDGKTAFGLQGKGNYSKSIISVHVFASKNIGENEWDTPQTNLSNINTKEGIEEDLTPDFAPDNTTIQGLMFSSTGQSVNRTYGTEDLYYYRISDNKVINMDDYLGTVVNTKAVDLMAYFDTQRNFYFSREVAPYLGEFLVTSYIYFKGAPNNEPQCIKSNGKCLANILRPTVNGNKLVFRSPTTYFGESDIFYAEKIDGAPNDFGKVIPWDNCGE